MAPNQDFDPLIDPDAADAAARAAFRRRRMLTIGLSAAAVLAVIAGGGLVVASLRSTGGTTTADPTHAAPTTAGPATPTPTTATPTPTPAVSSSAAATPSVRPSSATPSSPVPVVAPTGPPDLRISADPVVTLYSDGTVYRGVLTVTITNLGAPYGDTGVHVTNVNGVEINLMAGDRNFGPCLYNVPQGTTGWQCFGPTVPAGGTAVERFHLVANYAPLATSMTLTGFALVYQPGLPRGGGWYTDPTPEDDHVEVTIVLAAAA